MSDARELLAMMTVHGIEIGRPFGGIPRLTPLDIAGAMGMGLDPAGASLLLAKYCHDGQQYAELRVYWFERVMERKQAQAWKSDRPGLFKGLADVTLEEHVGHNLCRWCRGTGSVMARQKPVDCAPCGATGRKYYRPHKLAGGIGIKPQSYSAAWADRVAWCRVELNRWEIEAADRLGRALRGRS